MDFETFFDEHDGPTVRAVALAIGDRHRAEDRVQDAFAKAYVSVVVQETGWHPPTEPTSTNAPDHFGAFTRAFTRCGEIVGSDNIEFGEQRDTTPAELAAGVQRLREATPSRMSRERSGRPGRRCWRRGGARQNRARR